MKYSLDTFLGFGGVDPHENERALRWGSYLETPMLAVGLWIIIDWYLVGKGFVTQDQRIFSDWLIWSFFLVETLILGILCSHTWQHLRRNWANVGIIILAFPYLYDTPQEFAALRTLRLFFMVGFFSYNMRIVQAVLSQNHLGKTLIVSMMLITGGGIMIAGIDPAIDTTADGIWWAWVTVTTVGYGDIVPESNEGRAFASLLILMGICLVSLITANVSAYLLSKANKKDLRYEQRILKKMTTLEDRLTNIEKKIDIILDVAPKKDK